MKLSELSVGKPFRCLDDSRIKDIVFNNVWIVLEKLPGHVDCMIIYPVNPFFTGYTRSLPLDLLVEEEPTSEVYAYPGFLRF